MGLTDSTLIHSLTEGCNRFFLCNDCDTVSHCDGHDDTVCVNTSEHATHWHNAGK